MVLIPVLSGWFFRPDPPCDRVAIPGLNPRAFGVVFHAAPRRRLRSFGGLIPRAFWVVFYAPGVATPGRPYRCLNPRAFGVVFQASLTFTNCVAFVLIPVLSGWFFRPENSEKT